jgi:hypothetical protein
MPRVPLPPHIIPIWTVINDETVMVHAYWRVNMDLFGKSKEQVDLLDRSAGFFFFVIQDALATDIQSTLSKLSDPATTFKRENATVHHLLNEIEKLNEPALIAKLLPLYKTFSDACEPERESRNKVIAHIDRDIALLKVTLPQVVTVGVTEAALKALASFMNAVQSHFEDAETGYEHFGMRGAGADDLVQLLKMAERYQTLQEEGKIPWEALP